MNAMANKQAVLPSSETASRCYQKLLDSSPEVICSINGAGIFSIVSAAAKEMWGYAPSETKGKPYIDFITDEDKDLSLKAISGIMTHNRAASFQNKFICKDGSYKSILWSAQWDKEDGVMYCVAKDATKVMQAEKRLYRAYKLAGIAWWEYNVATQTYTSSDEIFQMYGLPIPENNQNSLKEFLSLVHPADKQRLQFDLTNICQDTYFNYEHRLIKPSGEVIYLIHYSEVIRDSNGKVISIHGSTRDITERKVKQLQLEESEKALQQYTRKLSDILESLGDGFYAVDKGWNITYWNNKAEDLLGRKKEQVLGKKLWHEYKDAIPLKFYTEYQRAFNENTDVHFEEYFPPLRAWFEVSAYPSESQLSVFFKNINGRKQQEKELQISNERFRFVSKATGDVIWDWNLETGELYLNQSFTRTFGYDFNAGVTGSQLWEDNLHPEDKDRVLASQEGALCNPDVSLWQDNYRFVKASGDIAHVIDKAVIVRNQQGKALRMIGAIQDITEQKRQEKRLKFIAKATSEVIWEREWNSEETEITGEKLKHLFGYEIKGNRIHRSFWFDKLHPEDKSRIKENRDYALMHGFEFFLQEYRFKKKDGTWAFVKDRIYIVKNEDGEPVSMIGAMEDVTNIRLAEKALMERENSYRQLFNSSPVPAMVLDKEKLCFLDVNDKAIEHYGYSREALLKKTFSDICPKSEQSKRPKALLKFSRSPKNNIETQVHIKKGGELILAEVSITTINYRGKVATLAMIKDITEKERLHQQLLHEKVNQQKNITKATIEAQEQERTEIGKELHDNISQLLATAKLYVENIKYYPEQSSHYIEKGVALLQRSVDEIRRLSRELVTPTLKDAGFKATLRELLESYKELRLFEVSYTFNFDEQVIDEGIKLTVYRIVQEQFNNAVKYAKASFISTSIECTKNTLQLDYFDDGVGFELSKVKKGLGLNNIKNRTAAYKGRMQLKASVGTGCQMKITFPLNKLKQKDK